MMSRSPKFDQNYSFSNGDGCNLLNILMSKDREIEAFSNDTLVSV